jgi:hypothetical protein
MGPEDQSRDMVFPNIFITTSCCFDDLNLEDLPKNTQVELKLHFGRTGFRLISWSVDVEFDSSGLNGIEDNSLGLAVELRLWELEELLPSFLRSERFAIIVLTVIAHNLHYC